MQGRSGLVGQMMAMMYFLRKRVYHKTLNNVEGFNKKRYHGFGELQSVVFVSLHLFARNSLINTKSSPGVAQRVPGS